MKFLFLFLLVLASLTCLAQETALIKLSTGVSTNSSAQRSVSLQSILDQYGATISQAYPTAQTVELGQWTIVECGGCNVSDLIAEVQSSNSSDVEIAVVEQEAELTTCADCPAPIPYNDPLISQFGTDHQISSLNSDCVGADHSDGETVTIAVIDSEFDIDHPDLLGRLTSVNIDHLLPRPASKSFGHGTNVAGLIIANRNNNEGIFGNCSTCNVVGYNIEVSSTGRISPNEFRIGGLAAMDDGHKIINFSIATLGDVSLVRNYFQEAEARGVYIVGSAGNTANAGSWNYSPDVTDIPGMFVVSSTRPYPDVTFDRGDYTLSVHNGVSFGHQVDFLGTGFRVAVTSNPDTDNHTGFYTINWGTSQAAPSVAGVIGSVLSVNSCLEAHDVEKLLKATACSDISGYSANQHGAGVVDQAAAVTRAREYSSTAEYVQNIDPIYVDDPVVWDDEFLSFNRQVIVRDGGSLSIFNSQINFSIARGITVESGGSLYATNSLFTYNRCADEPQWAGISADGSAFRAGNASDRPSVFLTGCTIEHANAGVANHDLPQPYAANGGNVTVEFTDFLNCKTGVSLFRADGAAPEVTTCTFELTDTYPFGGFDPRGISVVESPPGLVAQLASNTFTDQRSDRSQGFTGVNANNASFTVTTGGGSAGGSFGRTKFTNCMYGVRASEGSILNHLVEIRDAESENTLVSTWLVGFNSPQVINNTFQAQSTETYIDRFGEPIPAQGIRMEMCRRHIVEGNTINGGLTVIGQTFGIVIIGDAVAITRDAVYNNTLNTCQFGMLAVEENGGVDNISGLCYECNTFDGCETDISAQGPISSRQQGIENNLTASAGNVFEATFMQFESLVTSVLYFIADPAEEPNPRFNVNPVTTPTSNSCLPIFGINGGGNPTCEDVAFDEIDPDRQVLEEYYVSGTISEEEALVALTEFNRKYVMFTRELINEVDECESGSVEDWGNAIQSSAPWVPLDETLIAVYEDDYSSAIASVEGLEPLAGQTEVERLIGLLELNVNIGESSTYDEVEVAYESADLTAYLSESELAQSYAQTLARASAESFGLVAYEARLPDLANSGNGGNSQPLVIPTPYELQDVTIYDALGRQIAKPNSGSYLTISSLNEALSTQPNGIYYVSGVDEQGSLQTIAVSNVR